MEEGVKLEIDLVGGEEADIAKEGVCDADFKGIYAIKYIM